MYWLILWMQKKKNLKKKNCRNVLNKHAYFFNSYWIFDFLNLPNLSRQNKTIIVETIMLFLIGNIQITLKFNLSCTKASYHVQYSYKCRLFLKVCWIYEQNSMFLYKKLSGRLFSCKITSGLFSKGSLKFIYYFCKELYFLFSK